jgi:hypothetical protein
VCKKEKLIHVTYTYGDVFKGETNGRVRRSAELSELADEYGEFTVYVVEVCRSCGWNHLETSYVLASTLRRWLKPAPVKTGARRRKVAEE